MGLKPDPGEERPSQSSVIIARSISWWMLVSMIVQSTQSNKQRITFCFFPVSFTGCCMIWNSLSGIQLCFLLHFKSDMNHIWLLHLSENDDFHPFHFGYHRFETPSFSFYNLHCACLIEVIRVEETVPLAAYFLFPFMAPSASSSPRNVQWSMSFLWRQIWSLMRSCMCMYI